MSNFVPGSEQRQRQERQGPRLAGEQLLLGVQHRGQPLDVLLQEREQQPRLLEHDAAPRAQAQVRTPAGLRRRQQGELGGS